MSPGRVSWLDQLTRPGPVQNVPTRETQTLSRSFAPVSALG